MIPARAFPAGVDVSISHPSPIGRGLRAPTSAGTVSHFAPSWRRCTKSFANVFDSSSSFGNTTTKTLEFANGNSTFLKDSYCAWLTRRGANRPSSISSFEDAVSMRLSSASAFLSTASAWVLARVEASAAFRADIDASLAFPSTRLNNSPLAFLICVSIAFTRTSTQNSPATPMETSATPNSSIMNHNRLGRSGGCTNPRPQSRSSSLYSRITNTISITTPTATSAEKRLSHNSKESLDDSSREISQADC